MDFISSLTGKSLSTTGAGSEGALTKSLFNALRPIADLNNALVSLHPHRSRRLLHLRGQRRPARPHRSRHLAPRPGNLVPPRPTPSRDPVISPTHGHLERLADFDHNGETIPASRLGYRITQQVRLAPISAASSTTPARSSTTSSSAPKRRTSPPTRRRRQTHLRSPATRRQRVPRGRLHRGRLPAAPGPPPDYGYGFLPGKDVHHPEIRATLHHARIVVMTSSW